MFKPIPSLEHSMLESQHLELIASCLRISYLFVYSLSSPCLLSYPLSQRTHFQFLSELERWMGLGRMTITLPVSSQLLTVCLEKSSDSSLPLILRYLRLLLAWKLLMLFCNDQQKLQFSHPYRASVRIHSDNIKKARCWYTPYTL